MKKQKSTRSKWTYERALQLEDQRRTEGLSWKLLGKQEKMSAGAVKSSLQKWLKRSPGSSVSNLPKPIEKFLEENPGYKVEAPENAQLTFAQNRRDYHQRMLNAWSDVAMDIAGV